MKSKEYSIELNGKTLIAEFNDLAMQANGSVMMRSGNTVVLATAVMGKEQKDLNFFPLTVEYEERYYSTGKILGSKFHKREGRPSDEAILSGRIVDRTIRPLFDHHIRHEVQVILTILSIGEEDPDVLSVIGVSLALATSDIPWNGPVSAVRKIGYSFDLVACGKNGLINMIEIGGKEVNENDLNSALKKASKDIEKIQDWQEKIISEIRKKKRVIEKTEISAEIQEIFDREIAPILKEYVFGGNEKLTEIKDIWLKIFNEKIKERDPRLAEEIIENEISDLLHKEAIDNDKRADGRKMEELRPIFVKAGGISPILHGSGIFYRGETHILSVLTLGGAEEAQFAEGMEESSRKHFMHHYNFPPFSSGETGRIGGTNRRMIGHGALAEKAIVPIIPHQETFPYTIRIVSEALSSNGSTSMGSVCGSTLALMDAGVPIKAPVAGIAIGLMMKNQKHKILTDIQGPEDRYGDMDFKVAGTRNGITAVQMDIKANGIPLKIIEEAFEKAKSARLQILDLIEKEIGKSRENISPNAPKILSISIRPEQIGLIIGTGGKTIKEIKEKTGIDNITIKDDGIILITGKGNSAEKARAVILNMTK